MNFVESLKELFFAARVKDMLLLSDYELMEQYLLRNIFNVN
jgi:hypothetical protein